jgi:hypothetical protein
VRSRSFSTRKRRPRREADHSHNLLLKRYSTVSRVLERWSWTEHCSKLNLYCSVLGFWWGTLTREITRKICT